MKTNTSVHEPKTTAKTGALTRTPSSVTTTEITINLTLSTSHVTSGIISPTKSKDAFSSSVKTPEVFCAASKTGRVEHKGLLTWNMTKLNHTSRQQCPYGPLGENAVRKCEMVYFGAANWSNVDDTMCAEKTSCSAGQSGDSSEKGILNWPVTPIGMRANVSCPYNKEVRMAYRSCRMNTTDLKPRWNVAIHNEDCDVLEKNITLDKMIKMEINEKTERTVAASMNYLTSRLNIDVDVVKTGAVLLKNLVEKAKDLFQISTDLLSLVSNIMKSNSSILAAANQQDKSTQKILTYIGKMMENMNLNGGKTCCQPMGNVIAKAWDISNHTNKYMFGPDGNEVSITLPSSLLKRYDLGKRVYFFNFKNDKLFASLKNNKQKFINSEIVSATIGGKAAKNLSDPVVIEFKLTDNMYSGNSSCVFWDFEADGGYGGWSRKGCKCERIDDGRARCSCDHLTNFGILVDLFPSTTKGISLHLERITFIGCYLSIAGLLLTMITLLSFKKYRSNVSGKILFNLCLALLFVLLVFVTGIESAEEESTCVAIAVLLHYFILVVFLWMGIEAFYMFLNIVLDRLPGQHGNIFVMKCAAIAWVLPMFVVLITVLIKTDDYKDHSFCRISGNSFYIAFLVPILTILIFNFIIFVLVIKSLLSNTIRNSRRTRGIVHFRRVLGIMTVLGITWIFGILAVGDLRIVFQYLFCISTSFQGFLIFVIYCMTDRYVRERLVRLLCVLPDPNINQVQIDTTSTQHPTDIVIELDQFEPAVPCSGYPAQSAWKSEEQRTHPWPMTAPENGSRAWVTPEESVARPRVNVPLSDEPVTGVDKLVEATLSQSGLTLRQDVGETSLQSASGQIIFIDNGRVVDVPYCPAVDFEESSRKIVKKKRVSSAKNRAEIINAERSKDLRRWSEMGWSPRLKNYNQTLPDDLRPNDDDLGQLNLSHFHEYHPGAKRKGAHADPTEPMTAGDDVERGYFEKYLGNVDRSLSNSLASASGSAAIASTSNAQRQTTEPMNNGKSEQNPDSTSDSDASSSNASLKWSVSNCQWMPGPRSHGSLSTDIVLDSDDEIGEVNTAHFQKI